MVRGRANLSQSVVNENRAQKGAATVVLAAVLVVLVVQILALDHRRTDAKVTMMGEVANLVAVDM